MASANTLSSTSPSISATPINSPFSNNDDDNDFGGIFFSPSPLPTILADSDDLDTDDDNIGTLGEKTQNAVYQYYFLILVVGILLLIGGLLFMRRRRKHQKTAAAFLGRNALARDLESWRPSDSQGQEPPTTARRWMQRFGNRTGRNADENAGLNELGEAPPPYKAQEAALDGARNMPAVPLATLSRNVVGKPPGYTESVSRISTGSSSSTFSNMQARPMTSRTATSTTQFDLHSNTDRTTPQIIGTVPATRSTS